MPDVGFTHVALFCRNAELTAAFYAKYANMAVIHRRVDHETGHAVIWLSDGARPFVIVFIEGDRVEPVLGPFAHLGVGCKSRAEVDRLCDLARQEGALASEPQDWGPPVGYWALLSDPDGHRLELSYGQEVGLSAAP
jgi:catechol 2,3-dioxygenase-like lactoylglutathione lyase family enzyme